MMIWIITAIGLIAISTILVWDALKKKADAQSEGFKQECIHNKYVQFNGSFDIPAYWEDIEDANKINETETEEIYHD